MNELLDEVRQLAADVFSVPLKQVNLKSSPDSIGNWDSLQHLNLVLGLEQAFELEFAPEEIERMVSIETIVALVDQKLRER
jgi:acyl carrier protein